MWIATNKKNGATQRMTNAEKKYWENSVYGKCWTFEEVTPTPRAQTPTAVKRVKKKSSRKANKTKTAEGVTPDGND